MIKTFRVVAFGMHDSEIKAAADIMPHGQATESFVIGDADDAKLQQLRDAGLVIQVVGETDAAGRVVARQPETPGLGASPVSPARRPTALSRRSIEVNDSIDLTRPNFYLVSLSGPLLEDYRTRLAASGVELVEAYKDNCYTAYLTHEQVLALGRMEFVSNVELYGALQTVPSATRGLNPLGSARSEADSRQFVTYDVKLHRSQDLPAVREWLDQNHIPVEGASGRKLRILAKPDSPLLGELANLPEVASFEEYQKPKLWNDLARQLLKLEAAATPPFPYNGANQIVAVADTGIDDKHPDFAGRIVGIAALGRPGLSDDPNGHGTHVAGSVLGDGSASQGAYRGTAPAAKLYFQSLLDAAGDLGGLPLDLNELFEQAYQVGARIHNNSWGADTRSTYTMNSDEVDEFVSSHPDMLVVIAAGNEGTAAKPANSPRGVVDWLSIGAPGTAKNALTVGASRSTRSDGPLSSASWQTAWPNDFPDPPIAAETVSGNAECLAAFSSRGPSDDRRVKPDVVAPGTDILSTKSNNAPLEHFWGPFAQNTHYAFMGGTSMATPLVAGCAALVRQYYISFRAHEPSAALVRATLINGTRWLSGADANASNPQHAPPAGNFDQGFGAVDMSTTLPAQTDPAFTLAFVDTWQDPARALAGTGKHVRYLINVTGGAFLRICLAYTDVRGRGVQNNLNLFAQLPDNTKLVGNQSMKLSLNIPDVDNNVEVIRIPNPKPGPYLIQVTASNLLRLPQHFALVATGTFSPGSLQSV